MVFRFIIRYLVNNEQLINKLAESYPVRTAARLAVYLFTRTKSVVNKEIQYGKLKDISLSDMKNLASKLENTLKTIKEDLKKK